MGDLPGWCSATLSREFPPFGGDYKGGVSRCQGVSQDNQRIAGGLYREDSSSSDRHRSPTISRSVDCNTTSLRARPVSI